mgnify:CR=1 FL=1|tara:strand:- start:1621 stop:1782 length:162 start_codon:yes stop_codon:yes gene_type:complete
MWVVRNDEGEYWSNEMGWTERKEFASVVDEDERLEVRLPIGGEWALAWFCYDA